MTTAVSIGATALALIGFFLWLFARGKASAIADYIEDENRKLEQIHETRKQLVEEHEKQKHGEVSGNDPPDPSSFWR